MACFRQTLGFIIRLLGRGMPFTKNVHGESCPYSKIEARFLRLACLVRVAR
jgi:hypothetical protein